MLFRSTYLSDLADSWISTQYQTGGDVLDLMKHIHQASRHPIMNFEVNEIVGKERKLFAATIIANSQGLTVNHANEVFS